MRQDLLAQFLKRERMALLWAAWGEREIRWLYAKLSDIDNKLATGPGLQTPSAILDQDLDVRVGLLDGEVNMMKLEIDKLWATLKEILADLAEQKRTIDNGK